MKRGNVIPIEVDIHLDTHDGPSWEVAPLRHREGWLIAAEARVWTPFGERSRLLTVAVDDDGEAMSQCLTRRLSNLSMSLPRDPEVPPPEALSEALDAHFWDFLGASDLETLAELDAEQQAFDERIDDFEIECQLLEWKIRASRRRLRGERLRQSANGPALVGIRDKLARLEDMLDRLALEKISRVRDMRTEFRALETAVTTSLTDPGDLETVAVVRWRPVRSQRPKGWSPELLFGLRGTGPLMPEKGERLLRDAIPQRRECAEKKHDVLAAEQDVLPTLSSSVNQPCLASSTDVDDRQSVAQATRREARNAARRLARQETREATKAMARSRRAADRAERALERDARRKANPTELDLAVSACPELRPFLELRWPSKSTLLEKSRWLLTAADSVLEGLQRLKAEPVAITLVERVFVKHVARMHLFTNAEKRDLVAKAASILLEVALSQSARDAASRSGVPD